MNVHSVLEYWYRRIAHIGTYIALCIYIWTCATLCVMWKVCSIWIHTHMNDDLDNRGSLKGVPKNTLN